MIRVLLAEDHSLVRAGLVQLLAKAGDIDVVGVASDGEEAVAMAAERQPDVVLMDLVMPNMDGIEATRRIQALPRPPSVLVLTSFSDRTKIIGAIQAGAAGYLLKEVEPDELFRGVREAASGRLTLTPRTARAILAGPRPPVDREITAREREVLGLLRRGLSNKQIARELGVTEGTIKAHLTRIFERIGVTDRTQAALWAERRGLS